MIINCACRFEGGDGTPLGLCSYHEKAMKFVAKEARDAERKRIADLVDVKVIRWSVNGQPETAQIFAGLAGEIRETKAPIHVAVLKSTREDLLR